MMLKKFILFTCVLSASIAFGMEGLENRCENHRPIVQLPTEMLKVIESFLSNQADKARFCRVIYGNSELRTQYEKNQYFFEELLKDLKIFRESSPSYGLNSKVISFLRECKRCHETSDVDAAIKKTEAAIQFINEQDATVVSDSSDTALHAVFDTARYIDPVKKNMRIINAIKQVAACLIKKGASLTTKAKQDETALILAIEVGDLNSVKLILASPQGCALLDYQPQLNIPNAEWMSGLMIAVEKGYIAIVRELIAAGANPALQNSLGETAHQIAVSNNHTEIAQMLKEYEQRWTAEQDEQPTKKKQRKE